MKYTTCPGNLYGLGFQAIAFCFVLLIASGCVDNFKIKEVATFKEPQPVNKSAITQFPKDLVGKYISKSDSSYIMISETMIRRINDNWSVIALKDLDSTVTFQHDSLNDKENGQQYFAKLNGDSLNVHFYWEDTVYAIDKNHVVKVFKGNVFLNSLVDSSLWNVKKLSAEKGKLILSSIEEPEDIYKLGIATGVPIDNLNPDAMAAVSATPTKRQFKKFVKAGGFSASETFERMK